MAVAKQSVSDREVIVPPSLPLILKEFCKAAIRTQPYDLLRWSTSYFQALADGEEPPTKLRLEYPPPNTASGLTLGFLRILLRQFGGSSLCETMIMICELFTHEPEGGSAMVPVTFFLEIYGYLAGLCCDGSERNSSDEDPTEFIMCDSEYSGHQELNPEQFFIDRSVTSQDTSQDTEADINLDLELVSRKDTNSSEIFFESADTTPQSSESYVGQKKMIEDEGKQNFSNKETSKMKSNEISIIDVESNKRSRSIDEQNLKGENTSAKSRSSSTSGESFSEKQNMQSTKDRVERCRKRKTIDPKLLKYYPNVPGIGPRLSAEEVASVAIWLSECARVQEGMVGPRNLRHMNCPPLDRQEISGS
ncbi:uncharacterized protein LOC122537924 isoform X4 [Frieseomelitta varia]|uniref:uncharacterized protein LOC122537924 isoform X4 n=1 Tax=Frieseomelitta varia TaxID=561572 RepID=UPI001CB68134|nr:uncharacterized protein LOC122537924 isoform X4 [Frieseomelitta varia]